MKARELGRAGRRRRRPGGARRRRHRRRRASLARIVRVEDRSSPAAAQRRRHRPGRASRSSPTPTSSPSSRRWPTRSPAARMVDRCLVAAYDAGLDPLLVLTKADLRDPAGFRRQLRAAGRPLRGDPARRPGRRPIAGPGRRRATAGRPGHGAHRALRRRQVDPGQRPGAGRGPGDRSGQRRHRPGPAHLDLGGGAAAAGRRLGDRHPRRPLLRAGPRRPGPDRAPLPRPGRRDRRSARAAAPTTSRSAGWTTSSPPVGPDPPAPPGWSRCAGCCARAPGTVDDAPPSTQPDHPPFSTPPSQPPAPHPPRDAGSSPVRVPVRVPWCPGWSVPTQCGSHCRRRRRWPRRQRSRRA